MVRQSSSAATPQNTTTHTLRSHCYTPTRFATIDSSSYSCGCTTERSNCAPRVIFGLVMARGLASSTELSLSGSLEASLRLLTLQGLRRLEDSLAPLSALRGVTLRELLESCSTVFSGTYLLPLLRREEMSGFLFFLNSSSFTDLSPLSFSSTYRTRFFPVRFLKAVARMLASVLAPRDSRMRRSRPKRVRSMQSSQSMENSGEISIFY